MIMKRLVLLWIIPGTGTCRKTIETALPRKERAQMSGRKKDQTIDNKEKLGFKTRVTDVWNFVRGNSKLIIGGIMLLALLIFLTTVKVVYLYKHNISKS